ncbi:MAG: hypothetical protein DPW14_04515 [Planctomycetes bacterium]|nr:hypothetical protein [Planctomycetota bacterium]
MTIPGFVIRQLQVVGPDKSPASITFQRGLNVVAGASNTGKTYVYRVLDWMLGASEFRKDIPQADGYDAAYLEVEANSGEVHTLYRALSGGDFERHDGAITDIGPDAEVETLGARHHAEDTETVSAFLLGLSGLWGRKIKKNKSELRTLSFRDVARFIMVDEERVITEGSPARSSGQYVLQTPESAVFGLLLTGQDDSAVVLQEQKADETTRLNTEIALLEDLIASRTTAIGNSSETIAELIDRAAKLDEAIEAAASLRAVQQARIDTLSKKRDEAWSTLQEISSRKLFLDEQAKRLELLEQHYTSDKERLSSALEAGEVFERLPTGACPVCGHVAGDGEISSVDQRLNEFHGACTAELHKIDQLSKDLGATRASIRREQDNLDSEEARLKATLDESNRGLAELLSPRGQSAGEELRTLFESRKPVARALSVIEDIASLQARLEATKALLVARPKTAKLSRSVDTAMATDFCKVVEQTLAAWRFPFAGPVSFDPQAFDIVVGGQNRQSLGKGYRAVTHAAFNIGLMRYCRAEGIPHPGIVVIDTPLNPFRGPDSASGDKVSNEVQEAFFADLATHTGQDQVIVLENTEPPARLRTKMNYTHFSGNPVLGRAGFFPT